MKKVNMHRYITTLNIEWTHHHKYLSDTHKRYNIRVMTSVYATAHIFGSYCKEDHGSPAYFIE